MNTSIPFRRVIPVWGGVCGAYFLAAAYYRWTKSGINMWKI